jgi:3-oxoacyl-[acyl-carrier-protein] synthase-3
MMQVGILGIGTYLPEQVRRNDWWPTSYVEAWRQKRINRMTRGAVPDDVPITAGVRIVLEEMQAMEGDPFDGGRERRVIAEDMKSSDMEVLAAQRAIADAGISPHDIDVLLLQSTCPDYVITNNAAAVQDRIGLRQRLLSVETQGACNGFLLQLQLAEQVLRSGQSRYALLVQSSPLSRLMDPKEPFSVWFGDGATAVVVGAVPDGRGLLAMSTRSDGSVHRALVGTVDEKQPWHETGSVRIRALEPLLGRKMLLTSADLGKQALDDVMTEAGVEPSHVDFFACHQASSWFRRATQKLVGFDHARTVDTFPWAGNLAGANLPLVLDVARKESLLSDGDLVAMYAGGAGMTWSAALLRWGR